MAGKFDIGRILKAAGREPAPLGGRTADRAMEEISSVLDGWLIEVGGGDKELTDDATGTYIAVRRGSTPEEIWVRDKVNGSQTLDIVPGVEYDEVTLSAVDELLSLASIIDRESFEASGETRVLVDDFSATALELGYELKREDHAYGGGYTTYLGFAEGRDLGLQLEVSFNGLGCPSVSIQDGPARTEMPNLFYQRICTSDAAVTNRKLKDHLAGLLVRMAALRP